MASGPITSWQIDGEKVETVPDFILVGSKITVDIDGSHKTKRHVLLCHCVHNDKTWSELLIIVIFSIVLFLIADFKGCLQCLQEDYAVILNWNMLCIKKESK